MKFGLFSLVAHFADGGSQHERLRRVIDEAVLGFDAYGVGERHGEPFLSSAPPVLLAAIAERTSRVRLLTTLTVISVLAPVRVEEERQWEYQAEKFALLRRLFHEESRSSRRWRRRSPVDRRWWGAPSR
ncbi:MAG: hypothetical protein QOI78_6283 [Actinomycetota bacterium]|jgi:alkanesulfonate monooxygenase SsuD/methylene tetrahydromethanopterin reductase-like flavin-dependent oxidoreductase (luciferase family)|nr:hypothetical protein [Actinomycetota bacterium]